MNQHQITDLRNLSIDRCGRGRSRLGLDKRSGPLRRGPGRHETRWRLIIDMERDPTQPDMQETVLIVLLMSRAAYLMLPV